jgi:anaerobic dimethyl sulfoxide reductase subunit A
MTIMFLRNKLQRQSFLEWTGAIEVHVIAGGVGTKLLVDRQID